MTYVDAVIRRLGSSIPGHCTIGRLIYCTGISGHINSVCNQPPRPS